MNAKIIFAITSFACALGAIALPARAESPAPIHRFSAMLFLETFAFFPYSGFQMGYRLPILDNHIEPFIEFSPALFSSLDDQFAMMGGHYYFGSPNDSFRPYALASIGLVQEHVSTTSALKAHYMPNVELGIGMDWMPETYFGLSASLRLSAAIIQPQLGFKFII
jgi:hypothetical protein